MSLTRQDVAKVATLARLNLTEDELDMMTGQLAQVVEYFELLGELDTSEVEPMAHAVERTDVFRDDRVARSLGRDAALANAPKRDDECYRVPAVLGD